MEWIQQAWGWLTEGSTRVDALNFIVSTIALVGSVVGVWFGVLAFRIQQRTASKSLIVEWEATPYYRCDIEPTFRIHLINHGVPVTIKRMVIRTANGAGPLGGFAASNLPYDLETNKDFDIALKPTNFRAELLGITVHTACGLSFDSDQKQVEIFNEAVREWLIKKVPKGDPENWFAVSVAKDF
jgi:hypothetical protein